ncbi:MAG: hypothetical protein WD295_05035, partial [Bacteroidota bacterium]
MTKNARQLALKQIITHQTIGTQDELCRALKKAGFDVTQATLSRDIKDLGIGRINSSSGPRYILNPETAEKRLTSLIGYEIEDIDA